MPAPATQARHSQGAASADVGGRVAREFTFTPGPCLPDAFTHVTDQVERVRAVAGPDIAGLLTDLPADANGLHRRLLTARKAMSLYSPGRYDLNAALQLVRTHSSLYTPRICRCLRQQWATFVAQTTEELRGLDLAAWWGGRVGHQLCPDVDLTGPVPDDRLSWPLYELTACVGIDHYTRHPPRVDRLTLRASGPPADAKQGEPSIDQIEISSRTGRAGKTAVLTRVPTDFAQFAWSLVVREHPARSRYARSWLLTWPEQARRIAFAFQPPMTEEGHLGSRLPWVQQLLATGVRDLTAVQTDIAVRLASSWPTGPAELLDVVRGIDSDAATWEKAAG